MRQIVLLCAVACLFVLPSSAGATASWTIMVYMAADNNLEGAAIDDINEMEQVGSTADVKVVVQVDRAPGYDVSNGNWEDTRRYLITQDANTAIIGSPVAQFLGEKNMGEPATLSDFVSWSISNYPAQHYFLILWDHGQGWLKQELESVKRVGGLDQKAASTPTAEQPFRVSPASPMTPFPPPPFDQTGFKYACEDMTDNDRLYNHETESALSGIPKLDIIGFDACVMAMVETAYQLRNEAAFMVASEENEPGDGWPYNELLPWITTNPATSAARACSAAVLTYADYWAANSYTPDEYGQTLSAINLAQINSVAASLDVLVGAIVSGTSWSQIFAMPAPESFGDNNPFDDLYDFADLLSVYISAPSIVGAANDLKAAASNAVLINRKESRHPYAHGLSIFFPKTSSSFRDNDGEKYGAPGSPVDFGDSTQWRLFLAYYYGGGVYSGDLREPDNLPSQSGQPLSPHFVSQSIISSPTDEDSWLVHTGVADTLNLVLNSPANADLDLRLYDETGASLLAASLKRGNGVPDSIIHVTGGHANLYLSVSGFNSFSSLPYSLECQQSGYGLGHLPLSYDDGQPSTGWYSSIEGDAIGTTFNLPSYPMVLDRVWINVTSLSGTGSGDGSFYLLLYDNYGPIIDPIALGKLTPSAVGWNFLDLSDVQPLVYTSCFVGVWYDGINSPVVGSDSHWNGRDYYYSSSTGAWQPFASSLFIRLDVSHYVTPGQCYCECPNDPYCDGFTDVLDVVVAVNVAFRNEPAITDYGCPRQRTDVEGDGFSDVIDIVRLVNVAFRNASRDANFTEPCP